MAELQIDSWIVTWTRGVWRYAGRLAGMPRDRWTMKAFIWDAAECPRAKGRWQHGPKKRWSSSILHFLPDAGYDVDGAEWLELALDTKRWKNWEKDFCSTRW